MTIRELTTVISSVYTGARAVHSTLPTRFLITRSYYIAALP